MSSKLGLPLRLIFVSALVLLGCEDSRWGARETGAVTGGAVGAGLGAIVGNQVGDPGAGVAIGAAFGALSGALVGNEIDNRNERIDENDRRIRDRERELQENRRLIDELRSKGIEVRSTDRGIVVNLPDVLFEFGKASLTRGANRTVGDIVNVLGQNARGRKVAVEGHTDSVGSVEYNRRLSEDRARSVADALVQEGVPGRLISTRGFGESRPVASNMSADGRQRNRRVEVIIENR